MKAPFKGLCVLFYCRNIQRKKKVEVFKGFVFFLFFFFCGKKKKK